MTDPPISAEFPYESHYVDVLGSPVHYVEEGEGRTILFLHGNPIWSYCWRNVIPHVSPHGRCIAVDLIGMGRSGKPDIEYTFFDHVRYMEGFIEVMGLRDVTLVLHDWGGAIGLHYAMRNPSNVRGVVLVANGLRMLELVLRPEPFDAFPEPLQQLFRYWRDPITGPRSQMARNEGVEGLRTGCLRGLSDTEMAFYREPFPTEASRRPVWRWRTQIPLSNNPPDVCEAVSYSYVALQQSTIPKLFVHGTAQRVTTPLPWAMIDWFEAGSVPDTELVDVGPAGHYITEDRPHEIGEAVADWLGRR